jgi:hypothetical protein
MGNGAVSLEFKGWLWHSALNFFAQNVLSSLFSLIIIQQLSPAAYNQKDGYVNDFSDFSPVVGKQTHYPLA